MNMMRSPTKNDIEIQRIRSGAKKFTAVCDVIKTLLKSATFIALIICSFNGLYRMIDSEVDKMELLVKILEHYKIKDLITISAASLFGLAWLIEKKRGGRLIKKSGEMRHRLEHNDAFNGRSGLDDYGNAEEDKED